MFEHRVLGVDQGLSRCGIAILDGPGHRATVVDSEVVRTPADMALGGRLHAIHARLRALVTAHRPASMAVERVFINAQARTGTGAMQVVGLVHLLAADADLPVAEYTPSQVKAAVTGVGDADKDQVTFMVQRLLTLDVAPTPADRADAMAVGLCHLQQPGFGRRRRSGGQGRAGDQATTTGMSSRLAEALAAAGPGLTAVDPARPRPTPSKGTGQ